MHQLCLPELPNQRPYSTACLLHHQEAQTARVCSQGRIRNPIKLLSTTAHADDLPVSTARNRILTIQNAQIIPVT